VAALEGEHRLRFEIGYSRFNAVLFGLLGLPRRWSSVELVDEQIVVRMGWAFRARIPVTRVAEAAVAERPFVGWGVHGWRGRWLVNGSLRGIVSIAVDPPVRAFVVFVPVALRTVSISLADPERFLQALGARSPDGPSVSVN
jgi:hypothetical protein